MSTKTRTYLFIGWMNSTTPFQSNVSAMSLSTATLPSHNLARILIDSRIGQYAAVLSGDFKGWQGRLVRLTDATATIECPGRKGLCFAVGICHLNLNVLLIICSQNPDFSLAGDRLQTSYVGQSLMCPLTPPPRLLTPPSLFLLDGDMTSHPNMVRIPESLT